MALRKISTERSVVLEAVMCLPIFSSSLPRWDKLLWTDNSPVYNYKMKDIWHEAEVRGGLTSQGLGVVSSRWCGKKLEKPNRSQWIVCGVKSHPFSPSSASMVWVTWKPVQKQSSPSLLPTQSILINLQEKLHKPIWKWEWKNKAFVFPTPSSPEIFSHFLEYHPTFNSQSCSQWGFFRLLLILFHCV